MIAAAKQGFQASGFELNPWLVWYSRYKAWREGVHHSTSFHISDLWKVSSSQITGWTCVRCSIRWFWDRIVTMYICLHACIWHVFFLNSQWHWQEVGGWNDDEIIHCVLFSVVGEFCAVFKCCHFRSPSDGKCSLLLIYKCPYIWHKMVETVTNSNNVTLVMHSTTLQWHEDTILQHEWH